MAIDSTAELLFKINANADDAGENIARFRALMGQNIEGMASQFKDWADETIGEIDSVKTAMVAATAAIAAGVLAVGVAIKESTSEYQEYAEQIHRAQVLTGLHAEDLSALHAMAHKAGVDFETLTVGLGRFESNIIKAAQGSKQQQAAFGALGISQQDVMAGQKDMLPLLLKTMDGFHNMKSAVQQAAIERDLFGKGGQKLLEVLAQGSEAFSEAIKEAKEYGLSLSTKNVEAAHAFTVSQRMLKAELEGVATTIGKAVMPHLEQMMAMLKAGLPIVRDFAEGGAKGLTKAALGAVTFQSAYRKAFEEIEADAKKAKTAGLIDLIGEGTTQKIKEAKTEFGGLVGLVESLKAKIAEQGTPWDRLANEVSHYHVEIDKATAELEKLQKAGTITPESVRQSQTALAQIPRLLATVIADTTAKLNAEDTQRWGEAVTRSAEAAEKETYELELVGERRIEVTREIVDREAAEEDRGYAGQRAKLAEQMNTWAQSLAKKTALTAEDWNAIDRITTEGLAKIDASQTDAWQREITKLQEHLDRISGETATEQEKLRLTYERDLEQYGAVEEQKALKTAQTEAQVTQIQQTYAAVRAGITQKYQDDLQKLVNSQGFQGVFGSYFGNMIRSNQDLWRQWANSTNQSLLMVKMSMQALKDMSQQTFQTFIQGMGQTIATSLVAKTSIAQAMEQMLKSTVESFAGQAIVAALMATAWGFYWLMLQNYSAAGQAFTSAAIFGSVGAAAAVAGHFMPSGQQGAGAGPGASPAGAGGSAAGAGAGAAAGSGAAATQQPSVHLYVSGPVIGLSGAAQLADILNQAVYGSDVQLYASHNRQGVPL